METPTFSYLVRSMSDSNHMADLSDMASLPLNKDSSIGYDVGHFPEDFLYLLTKN